MFDINETLSTPPYSLNSVQKASFYKDAMRDLTFHHYERCVEYRKILDGLRCEIEDLNSVSDFPYLPVRLFKTHELASVDRSQIVKTMTSSGTTGQAVSKIFLDRETSAVQTKALAKIMSDFLGPKRLPMIIVDSSEVLKNRNMFSARGAGILGFSMLGRDVIYALDENMNINYDDLKTFLEKHDGETILLFGFTFMIWEHFYRPLAASGGLDIGNGILIHGGGWKKLQNESVGSEHFKYALRETLGLRRVHNYYGMVEQTGSIFMECKYGRLHCSVFSDVIMRRHRDFSQCDVGEQGLVQVMSLLPRSYPGHSILTEDMGRVIGDDNCPCGRLGRTFSIDGRIQQAEVRGCSDTYER
jgi:phenylacetate-coenzyme A ligase PaaK-like adenylate-forming protein